MATKRRLDFNYERRSEEDIRKHQAASTGRTGYVVEGTKMFSPKAGNHTIRILPYSWKDKKWGKYFGIDVYAHYDIGPDHSSFLCLEKMKIGSCPLCDERDKAAAAGDDTLAQKLRPNHRVACWVIDRNAQRDGPMLFLMPHTLDQEIQKRLADRRTGEIYDIDNPEEGYDIDFEREGESLKTKYGGVQFNRKATPLSEDDDEAQGWLDFIKENPVPDVLVFQDEDYLRDVVGDGLVFSSDAKNDTTKKRRDDDDDERPRSKPSRRDEEDDDEPRKPSRPRLARDDDDEDEQPRKKAKPARDEDDDDDDPPFKADKKKARDEEEDTDEDEEKDDMKERLRKIQKKTTK